MCKSKGAKEWKKKTEATKKVDLQKLDSPEFKKISNNAVVSSQTRHCPNSILVQFLRLNSQRSIEGRTSSISARLPTNRNSATSQRNTSRVIGWSRSSSSRSRPLICLAFVRAFAAFAIATFFRNAGSCCYSVVRRRWQQGLHAQQHKLNFDSLYHTVSFFLFKFRSLTNIRRNSARKLQLCLTEQFAWNFEQKSFIRLWFSQDDNVAGLISESGIAHEWFSSGAEEYPVGIQATSKWRPENSQTKSEVAKLSAALILAEWLLF